VRLSQLRLEELAGDGNGNGDGNGDGDVVIGSIYRRLIRVLHPIELGSA
jgi:hypothetical protein